MTELELKQLKERLKEADLDRLVSAYAFALEIGFDSERTQVLADEINARGYEVKWEG